MTDFNTPTNSSLYTAVLTALNGKISSVAKMDFTGDTNMPTGTIALNTSTRRFQSWNGSAFVNANFDPSPWGDTTGGTASAYTASPNPSWSSYTVGDWIRLIPHASNTGTATLAVSGLSAIPIRYMNQALVGGELVQFVECALIYDGTYFNLINHGGGWATHTPTYSATGTGTPAFGSVTTNLFKYQRHGNRLDFQMSAIGTTSGTTVTGIDFTLPITAADGFGAFSAWVDDGGGFGGYAAFNTNSKIIVKWYDSRNFGIGVTKRISCMGTYTV